MAPGGHSSHNVPLYGGVQTHLNAPDTNRWVPWTQPKSPVEDVGVSFCSLLMIKNAAAPARTTLGIRGRATDPTSENTPMIHPVKNCVVSTSLCQIKMLPITRPTIPMII